MTGDADKPKAAAVKPVEKRILENPSCLDNVVLGNLPCGARPTAFTNCADLDARVVGPVLTSKECSTLVEITENAGYSFWNAEAPNNYRNAYTVEACHSMTAQVLWERMKEFIPLEVIIEKDTERYERDTEGAWDAIGVNDHLLFAKYYSGGHFSPHTDGYTIMNLNERSFFSVIIYLNDCKEGGGTLLFSKDGGVKDLIADSEGRFRLPPGRVLARASPRSGQAIVFFQVRNSDTAYSRMGNSKVQQVRAPKQDIIHEGEPVGVDSVKYIIRTDIIFRRRNPICTSPNDLEAYKYFREAELLEADGKVMEAAQLYRRAFKMSPELAAVFGC